MSSVLSSNDGGCNCGCGGGSGIVLPSPGGGTSGAQTIIVRSAPNLKIGNIINKYIENGVTIYQLEDFILVKPIVSFSNDAPLIEVGETIDLVQFSGNIQQGSYPIVTRTLTPDPGGVDLTAPFTFNVEDVKLVEPGTAALHILSAIDNQGNTTSVQSGVNVKYAFYQGFSSNQTLDQAQIKALVNRTLNDNILQQYGGKKTYVVPSSPAVPKYIQWWWPNGTTGISAALLGGFNLPLVDSAPVNVTNPHDGTIITSYVGKRTANLLDPGTYEITVS